MTTLQIQALLTYLGYDPGEVDGMEPSRPFPCPVFRLPNPFWWHRTLWMTMDTTLTQNAELGARMLGMGFLHSGARMFRHYPSA